MKITVGRSFRIREFENYRVEFLEVEIAEGKDPIDATEDLGKMCLEARDRYVRLEEERNGEEESVPASMPSKTEDRSEIFDITDPQKEAIETLRDSVGQEATRIIRTFELKIQRNIDQFTKDDAKDLIGELNASNRARMEEAEARLS